MQYTPIKTGLCSYGMSGSIFHGPLLHTHPGFEITMVLERTKELSKRKYNTEIARKYEDLLQNKKIELIVVNTPDDLHYEMTKKAILAGKNVVVEKPFTLTSEEGAALIELSHKHGTILSVFQNRRWDGDFLTVQKIIENTLLGRLVEYEAHFDRYRNFIQDSWKEDNTRGTGTIYNLGSHLIDQALVLFGMPQSVCADIRIQREGGKVDDSFDIRMDYPAIKVTLKAGYLVRKPGPRYILNGTYGSFRKYGLDPQEEALKKGYLPDTPDWGEESEELWGILNTEINGLQYKGKIKTIAGNYLTYYTNIYEAIRKGNEILVKPEEGLNVIKIIEAAKQSNEKGKKININ